MSEKEGEEKLNTYKVESAIKNCEFWQRDSLADPVFTREVALQKSE